MPSQSECAVLAGGCFWCLDAVYRQVRGVRDVVSGYMGGSLPDPDYDAVCTGRSGHAEVVQIEFDPEVISYRDLLEVFFVIHDPTQLNRQGNDVGSQYRSAIFWRSDVQRVCAEQVLAELEQGEVFAVPIVTELTPATTFYAAEAYHQDYFRHHPGQGYCAFVVSPKLDKFRAKFAHLLKQET
ncbi:MAG: msrA [Proteobacteria bacterium]|nr:msrA [Pseudomonadota bacterium]